MARGAREPAAGNRGGITGLRWTVAALAAAACGMLAYAGAGTPQEAAPADVKLIFPQDRTVTFYGNFDLICQAPSGKLKVDGRPQAWQRFQAPLRVAHLGLEPGAHQLEIDGRRVDLFVSLGPDEHDWPRGWTVLYGHQMEPGPKRCGYCHKTSDQAGQTVVGPWRGAEACQECHRPAELEAKHAHPMEQLRDCPTCHGVHGSRDTDLLRQPVKKLCTACHDA